VPIAVHNKIGKYYVWLKGDGTQAADSFNQVQADSIITITYNTPGTFYLYLQQTDTTYVSLFANDPPDYGHYTCTTTWPDSTNPSQPRFKIVVHPHGPLDITGDTIGCPNTSITFRDTIKDTSYHTFIWNFANGSPADTFHNTGGKDSTGKHASTVFATTGFYWVKLKAINSYGCDSLDSFKIHILPIKANFTIDSTLAEAGIFTFHNTSVNAVKWQWSYYNVPPYTVPPLASNLSSQDNTTDSAEAEKHNYASSLPAIRNNGAPAENAGLQAPNGSSVVYEDSFQVCLKATNLAGCSSDTCKYVNVKRIWEPYNVITPNGDGINDTFKLRILGATYYHLLIFNRWGEEVFESDDQNNCWTGKNKNDGSDCPAGTYYYIWKFQLMGLPMNEHTGSVTIVK